MSDMQKHPGSLEASDAQVAAQDLVSQAAKTSTAKKANTQKTGFGGLQAGFFAKDRSGKSSSSDRPTALHAKAETEAEQSATSDARPRTDGSDDSTDGPEDEPLRKFVFDQPMDIFIQDGILSTRPSASRDLDAQVSECQRGFDSGAVCPLSKGRPRYMMHAFGVRFQFRLL